MNQIFSYYWTDGLFWVRVFGVGVLIANRIKHKPLFSERMGYAKFLRLGKFSIKYLPKLASGGVYSPPYRIYVGEYYERTK